MKYFLSTILFSLVFFAGVQVQASTTIDFEDKTIGNDINSYDYWAYELNPSYADKQLSGLISTDQYRGSRSLSLSSETYYNVVSYSGFDTITASSTFDFWVYYPYGLSLKFYNSSDCEVGVGYLASLTVESQSIYLNSQDSGKDVANNSWTHVYMQYDATLSKLRVSVDEQASWSTWKSQPACASKTISTISFSTVETNYTHHVYIDDVTIPADEKAPLQPVIVDTQGFGLTLISPVSTTYPNFTIQPVGTINTTFVFNYSLPNQASSTDFLFKVFETDSSFASSTQLLSNSIHNLDLNNTNQLRETIAFTGTTTRYFLFEIYDVAANVARTTIKISVNDSSFSDVSTSDLGFWGNLFRSLFVLSPDVSNDLAETKETLMTKVPFGYSTLIKEQIASTTYSGDRYDPTNLGSGGTTIFSPFRTIFTTAFWLMFAIFLVIRIRHLKIN